jgi:hypothetical protein
MKSNDEGKKLKKKSIKKITIKRVRRKLDTKKQMKRYPYILVRR